MKKQVNVSMDEETEAQLAFLTKTLEWSRSAVLKFAVDRFYNHVLEICPQERAS